MRQVSETAGADIFPCSVRQLADAVGCSRTAVYKAISKRNLICDPDAKPLLIVRGLPPLPRKVEARCPYTIDMFDEARS